MEQFTYKGHAIEVHEGYYGKSIYIRNAEGVQVYGHKFTGDAMERAKMILGEEVKANVAAVSAITLPLPAVRHIACFVNQPTLTPAQAFQARVNRILEQIAA